MTDGQKELPLFSDMEPVEPEAETAAAPIGSGLRATGEGPLKRLMDQNFLQYAAYVIRDRATLVRETRDGLLENVYRLQVMNGTEAPQRFRIEVEGLQGAIIAGKSLVEVGSTESRWVPVSVQLPPETAGALGAGAHPMRFNITRLPDASGGEISRIALDGSVAMTSQTLNPRDFVDMTDRIRAISAEAQSRVSATPGRL